MNQLSPAIPFASLASAVARHRHLIVPVSCLALIAVLIVPVPPPLMDLLICVNLALAAIILLTTIYMPRPVEFSVFPTLLLGTTLFRLVLNIASTRLILTADAASPAQAEHVAGEVIRGFGEFVARDSQVVGFIIFLILIVVQFVVITKGATRMSEVAARFALDAMPGKQMAIDADLSAGLISESEARERRAQVVREADFYGSMDGASKFVRGDAIAGLAITVINILGGFAIGVFEKGWTISESLGVFTMLTIGDGLVSQIPAFIIAIAAGLIVARASDRHSLGEEIPAQLVSQPAALYLIAGFLALLAFSPLPALPLLAGSALLCLIALGLRAARQRQTVLRESSAAEHSLSATRPDQPALEDLLRLDAMEIEIGFGLVPMVDAARGGDLLDRIAVLRRTVAAEIGIVVPPIRIRDNMALAANDYRIKLRGGTIGEGAIHRDRLLAMWPAAGVAPAGIDGIEADEPVFGLPALWIEPALRARVDALGCSLVEPDSIIPTHLSELIRKYADEILTREEVNHLIDEMRKSTPKLVEETIPALVKPGELQRVLQSLLRERVPIRDLETIVETLADWKPRLTDPDILTEHVRHALRRTISSMHAIRDDAGRRSMRCITLAPEIEELIAGSIERGPAGTSLAIAPEAAAEIARAIEEVALGLTRAGRPLIVVASAHVRSAVRRICDGRVDGAIVLSHGELTRDVEVIAVGSVAREAHQDSLVQV